MNNYDSRSDTYSHILVVQRFLLQAIEDLLRRMISHDLSKLETPEKEAYDVISPRLRASAYGSEEYKASLREMKPAIQHHYQHNSHHPEHYDDGIRGMSLLDLIEMLCDWKAAGMRHADNPGLEHSIDLNQDRFRYSDELRQIMLNTAAVLEA